MVPRELQQFALMIGIVMALVMRAIFIAVGAAAIENFSWIFYLFGLFLIYTAWKLIKEGAEDEDDYEENRLVRWVEKRFPATTTWHGRKILTVENGKRVITPLAIVILTLGTTDLLFALDSIPAIYGLTSEPYLVLTANIFALMGLRQLYFLIGGLLERLIYLVLRAGDPARLHRREAHPRGAAPQRAAVHQRRRARRMGARDPDLALAHGHRGHPRGDCRDFPDGLPPHVEAGAGRRHRPAARLGG